MKHLFHHAFAAASAMGLALTMLLAMPASAVRAQAQSTPVAAHRVAIQVATNDPATMTLALNNAQNILSHYKAANQTVAVVVVGYGPGLHLFREDTSPLKTRLATMALEHANLSFAACGNTQANMAKAENKAAGDIKLVAEANVVPSGVVTLMELQKAGYAYIRP
jgi:uncharacterized protein